MFSLLLHSNNKEKASQRPTYNDDDNKIYNCTRMHMHSHMHPLAYTHTYIHMQYTHLHMYTCALLASM